MKYPPPGRLVDAGGHRLHIHSLGRGPTVVFEAALGGSSVSWSLVQRRVAEFARACATDRAGFGWSDAGPMPRTAGRIADELKVLLERSSELAPYVLVGHSFGGLVCRIFAGRYPSLTAGLVLVDPAQPEDWLVPSAHEQRRIDRGVVLCRYGARAARLGIARAVSALVGAGALAPAWALARSFTGGELKAEDQWVLTPFLKLPPEVRGPVRQFWTQSRFFEALGSQIETMATSARETLAATPDGFGDLPLVTISAHNPGDHRMRQQTAIAASSTRGRHVIASTSGHWVPMDDPGVIVRAVEHVVKGAEGTE